jgi:uncharacterized membrane protein
MQAHAAPLYFRSPWYFSLLLLLAVAGFFPSYFARLGQAKALHHFHGIVATLWMLLLIGQGYLMRRKKVALHRATGKLSLVLVPLFAVSGLLIVHDMLTRDSGFARTFGPRLAFIDISTVVWFVLAYCMALRYRRDMPLHARFMVSTALPLLPPALSRVLGHFVLPASSSFDMALHLSFAAAELIVLALLLHDRQTGKVRAPYQLLMALLVVQHASFMVSMQFAPWRAVVAAIQGW